MPRERVANKVTDFNAGTVTFEFLGKPAADGKRPVTSRIVVKAADFSPEIQKRFMLNGIAQKLGDSYADSDDGTPAENVKWLIEQLQAGTWAQRGGGGGERTSYLLRALIELYDGKHKGFEKFSEEEIREYLGGLSDAEKKALLGNLAVAPIVDRMKAEDAAKRAQASTDAAKGKTVASPLAGLKKKA